MPGAHPIDKQIARV